MLQEATRRAKYLLVTATCSLTRINRDGHSLSTQCKNVSCKIRACSMWHTCHCEAKTRAWVCWRTPVGGVGAWPVPRSQMGLGRDCAFGPNQEKHTKQSLQPSNAYRYNLQVFGRLQRFWFRFGAGTRMCIFTSILSCDSHEGGLRNISLKNRVYNVKTEQNLERLLHFKYCFNS